MVKSYLRHGPTEAFGLICSSGSNSVWDGKFAYVPALEDVLVWNVKKAQLMAMWHETGHRAEVTCIQKSPKANVFAVGYTDGSVRFWNSQTKTVTATFNGHKGAVTALAFDARGDKFASGSQDTDVILWDIVAETGLFRLRGHRNQITAIRFITVDEGLSPSTSRSTGAEFLLTSSKDSLLKLWDLTLQHCVRTLVGHPSEVWSMDINPSGTLILTGGGEGELKAWKINHDALREGLNKGESGEFNKVIEFVSPLSLSTKHRVSEIAFHSTQPYLAVQSHDKTIDVFRVRTQEEIKKKHARRRRREREKAKAKKAAGDDPGGTGEPDPTDDEQGDIALADLYTPYLVVRTSGKVRSFMFSEDEAGSAKGAIHLLVSLATNCLEYYSIPGANRSKTEVPEASRLFALELPGHRSYIRTLCLSSDDQLLASASNGELKVWNMKSTACIRTFECSNAVCSTFLPGDRQIAVGSKSGEICLYDLGSSSLVESVSAHSSTLWSMHVRPDGQALVTGGADKDIKFWEFEREETSSTYNLGAIRSLAHVRTLKMTDDVLAVRYSPNGKLLCISLMDSTVKIFYEDSLKFFLSLYGHKLPVLSMDISDDSKLIITCSADKNVKIWGLDFGDCHKSIFAHDESIMQVAFERDSHYFWSVGKDKLLKYWDGDKFENIQKLEAHHGEIWAMAVSHQGRFVVTGSHDKSIRIWEKLDEPLFLEEEREIELERVYENGALEARNKSDAKIGSGVPDAEASLEPEAEATGISKQTTETLMAGERIIEALELADADRVAQMEYVDLKARLPTGEAAKVPPPSRHVVFSSTDMEPHDYVLEVVQKIHSTALTDALLVLPFGMVLSLINYMNEWIKSGKNVILVSRILAFLLKTHHRQIVAHRALRSSLILMRKSLRDTLQRQKDIIAYNLAALRYVKRQDDSNRTASFLETELQDEQKVKEVRDKVAAGEGKKRKRVAVRA